MQQCGLWYFVLKLKLTVPHFIIHGDPFWKLNIRLWLHCMIDNPPLSYKHRSWYPLCNYVFNVFMVAYLGILKISKF